MSAPFEVRPRVGPAPSRVWARAAVPVVAALCLLGLAGWVVETSPGEVVALLLLAAAACWSLLDAARSVRRARRYAAAPRRAVLRVRVDDAGVSVHHGGLADPEGTLVARLAWEDCVAVVHSRTAEAPRDTVLWYVHFLPRTEDSVVLDGPGGPDGPDGRGRSALARVTGLPDRPSTELAWVYRREHQRLARDLLARVREHRPDLRVVDGTTRGSV